MTEKKVDFSKYGKSFQEKLCQLILQDRAFCDQIAEVLDIEFLELRYLRVFVRKVFDYKKEYKVHPSTDIMITILRSDLDFCRKQKLKEAMIQSARLIQTSSLDEISTIINDALKLGADNDVGYDYIEDFEERFKLRSRNPASTGWDLIDEICKGGLGIGELGVAIAPTGAGKSMALVHLGAAAVKTGRTVVHYTLELADTVVATRYDSCITGFSLTDIISFKDHVYEKIKDIKGKLIVKEYPTKSASPNTIRNHLEKLRQRGITPELIIVDYGDLLRPSVIRKEKRHELETIYEQMPYLDSFTDKQIGLKRRGYYNGVDCRSF